MSVFRLAGVAGAALGSLMLLVHYSSGLALLGAFILVAGSVWYAEHTPTSQILPFDRGVLITGCDTGFGHQLAHVLDTIGMTVFAGCLNAEGEGAKALREDCTDRLHVLQMDVTNQDQVDRALEHAAKHLPKLGLFALVNNAGVSHRGEIECIPMEHFDKQAQSNILGMARVTKACLPLMRKSKGRIINVSSVKGVLPLPYSAAYNLTKYAVEGFSDCLRLEMRKWGVKVVIIEPGHFGAATRCFQMDRLKGDFEQMWDKASKDVKEDYGKDFIVDGFMKVSERVMATSTLDMTPVVDAMKEAVLAVKPRTRYLIGGSNKLMDPFKVLTVIYPYVPTCIMDEIIMWSAGGFPVLPKALREQIR